MATNNRRVVLLQKMSKAYQVGEALEYWEGAGKRVFATTAVRGGKRWWMVWMFVRRER